ncbi:MAG: DNA adenine methylase [Myxococcota bacterium]|jgi:DNA adenine methylase
MSASVVPFPTAKSRAIEPASPVLKWVGGKRRLLPEIIKRLPDNALAGRYYEPFLGGAAVFLALQPQSAVLSDLNGELINLYTVVRDNVDALIADLGKHRYEKAYFYAVRAQDPRMMTSVERASRMVFLNRTCFNGLYRVNKRGQFNVPFGRYSNPTICNPTRLRAAGEALRGVLLSKSDFLSATETAQADDFVYFDPPYVPLSSTANFTAYTKAAFGPTEQGQLADLFADLTERGVRCMQSNSDTPLVRELYADFDIDVVTTTRPIARDPESRGPVHEVLIRNY